MTDIAERVQRTVAAALEADAEAQKAEEASRAEQAAREQTLSNERQRARQEASAQRVAVWDARRRKRTRKPTASEEPLLLPLGVVTAILEGKSYSTETATAIAANSAEGLGDGLGNWWALPIPHMLYRAPGGSYFERFYQRLSALSQEKALELYEALLHKLPFAEAFPGVEVTIA